MRGARSLAQFGDLFVRDVHAGMHAHQLRPQRRLSRPHQLDEWMLTFQFIVGSALWLQFARVLSDDWRRADEDGHEQESRKDFSMFDSHASYGRALKLSGLR